MPSQRLRSAGLAASFAAATALLGACSGVGVLNAVAPSGGVAISTDLAYAPGPRGGLDVYRPTGARGPAPVVVFIYGGGWDSGRRQDYRFVGLALARRGYVTVVPDYRLYPQVRWPAFLQDNAVAVRWARDHAAQYGGDPARMVLMGHSAGAYDAVMLGLDRRWLAAVGMDPRRDLKGVVGLAGPYDFLPLDTDKLRDLFGPPDGRPATQPINHVSGDEPPLFLGVDVGDKVVRPGNTTRLAAKARAAGAQVEVRAYKGVSHALLVGAIAAPLRFLAPVLADSARFIDARTGAAPSGPTAPAARP